MARHLALLRLVTVVALTSLTIGCSAGGEERSKPGQATSPPKSSHLVEAWQVAHDWAYASTPLWQTEESIVFGTGSADIHEFTELTGIDRATGEEAWRLPLARGQETCAVSEEANENGIAGLRLNKVEKDDEGGCVVAAALDLDSGELLWKRTIPRSPTGWNDPADIAISDKTVSVAAKCSVFRYDALTGRALPNLGDPDGYECHLTDSDLLIKDVLVERDVAVILTHDHWRCDRSTILETYDADSGRRTWRGPVADCNLDSEKRTVNLDPFPSGQGVVSVEPLVIDAKIRDIRGYRAVDKAGRLPLIGQPTQRGATGDYNRAKVLGVVDEVLMVVVGATVQGYDLRVEDGVPAGKLLWKRALGKSEQVLGVGERGLLTLQTTGQGDQAKRWLTISEAADGNRVQRLGTVPPFDGTSGFVPRYYLEGDLLVEIAEGLLHALKIPAGGEA